MPTPMPTPPSLPCAPSHTSHPTLPPTRTLPPPLRTATRDEQFVNYQTSAYKLPLFETPSGYKFVMLSDPAADSLRFVLRQIYAGPFLEYVVRNPLVPMDARERGIDNEYFRMSTDRLVRGLTVFQ